MRELFPLRMQFSVFFVFSVVPFRLNYRCAVLVKGCSKLR